MPFSVVHSDGDSESEGEALSGQPAFSSVLTVMAGTVKRPVSLDQSRTLPTVTSDETHTTQWPSHSFSEGSEMSASSSYVGDRILAASSGLAHSTFHQHHTPTQAVTMSSDVARPSHVSLVDASSFSSSLSSSLLSSSLSPSAPSVSSVLPSSVSLFSLSASTEWIKKAASSQVKRLASTAAPRTGATLSPAGSRGWTGSVMLAQPPTLSATRLPAVTQGLRSTTIEPFQSKTSTDGSNIKSSFHSLVDKIGEASGTSANTGIVKTQTITSAYTSFYMSYRGHGLLELLHGPTQTHDPGTDSVSVNNPETSILSPPSQDSQAVQRLQVDSPALTSARQPAHLKGSSVSSRVTQQILNPTAYVEQEDKTAIDRQAFVHKFTGDPIMSPLTSHVVNPAASPAITLRSTGSFITVPGKTSFFESAVTMLTPIHSSEHASNPDDLLMAAGHGSPRVPAINMNYNQGAMAGAELKPISTQDRQNNSLSLTQSRPESTSSAPLGWITRSDTASSASDARSPHFPTNRVVNTEGTFKWKTPAVFSSNTTIMYRSGSALVVRSANDVTYKTRLSHTPTHFLLPSFVSRSPNRSDIDDNTGTSANSELHFSDQSPSSLSSQITPPTRPFLLITFNTTSPNTSQQTVKSGGAGHVVHTGEGSTLPPPSPAGSVHTDTVKSSVSAPLNGHEETTPFNKKRVPSGQITTRFPSFITAKNVFLFSKSVDVSTNVSPTEAPRLSGEVTLEPPKIQYEESAPRTESSSSQGPISSVSSDKSTFYLGGQTSNPFIASSAAATSSTNRQNSNETLGAIFSFGTKLMAPYTKLKSSKHVPFQSGAFQSENASTGFDRAHSSSPADGPSYKHPKLGNEHNHNVLILNLTDPTAVTSDPYSLYPAGDLKSFTYVRGTSKSQEQSLTVSPANLTSSVAVSVQRGATAVITAAASETFQPLPRVTTLTSPQTASVAPVYNSNPALADTLSNSTAHSGAASRVKGFPSHEQLMPSSPVTLSPSSSNPLSLSVSAHLVSSSVSTEANHTRMYLGTSSSSSSSSSSSFSSSSPSLKASTDSDHWKQHTDTSVVLTEAWTDELSAGTARADALTFPKEKEASLVPSELGRVMFSAGPTERTSQVPPLSPRQDTTTASVKLTTATIDSTTKTKNPAINMPSLRATAASTPPTTATTPQPSTVTRRTTTTTTIRAQTSRRTFSPPAPRTSPPRAATTNFISPFTTTTEAPLQQCNITERLWVKTGTVNNAAAADLKKYLIVKDYFVS